MDAFNIVAEYELDKTINRVYALDNNIFLKIKKCEDFIEISKKVDIDLAYNEKNIFYITLFEVILLGKHMLDYEIIDDGEYYYILYPIIPSAMQIDFLHFEISSFNVLAVKLLVANKNVYPDYLFCYFEDNEILKQITKVIIDTQEVDFEILCNFAEDNHQKLFLKIIRNDFNYKPDVCRSIEICDDDKHYDFYAKIYKKY